MKKWIPLLAVFLCAVLLAGCAALEGIGAAADMGPASLLPEGYDEQTLLDAADRVVQQMNSKDYDALTANFTEEMAAAITAEELDELWGPVIDAAGEFQGLASAVTAVDEQNDPPAFVTVVSRATYQNAQVVFTLSFDSAYRISGLYFK